MAVAKGESRLELNQNVTFLEETFYVPTKKHSVFRVKLTGSGLRLIKVGENQTIIRTIPIKDIIGCRCLRNKKRTNSCSCRSSLKEVEENSGEHDADDVSAYLYICAYILQNNRSERERNTITLRFRSFDNYEDNCKEAQRWRSVLKKLMEGEEIPHADIADYTIINHVKQNRKLLVLLSPKSGSGKGRILFQKKIVPILQEAEVPFDLQITKYANYAREFVRMRNIFEWSGIVVVGGDGVVFEVINGMFERQDWSEVLKHLAVGVVPGGSGNGLARSIAYNCSEPYDSPTLPAALALIRNNNELIDLVRVETTLQIMFSFLSIGWGLLSDIDIESERLRLLGGQRFTLWAMARLIGLRSYSGKVYYLPAEANVSMQYNENGFRETDDKSELSVEVDLETQPRQQTCYNASSRSSVKGHPMYGPGSQLPSLTAPLPTNWLCMSGRFVMVHAAYQTHISSDCLFAPNAKLNDGVIWLLVIRESASRPQILQFLLGLSTGAHFNPRSLNSAVELLTVRAFRIEPDLHEKGYLTVDGELVEYGPIQAEVFPGLGRVMVP